MKEVKNSVVGWVTIRADWRLARSPVRKATVKWKTALPTQQLNLFIAACISPRIQMRQRIQMRMRPYNEIRNRYD